MSGPSLAAWSFAMLIGLMAIRMPIGLAMLAVGAAGYAWELGFDPLLNYLKTTPYYLFGNYTLSVIPLFVLMGALAEQAGLTRNLFDCANAFLGRRRGGVAMATIAAAAGFGAICGSAVATTASIGRVALPELRRLGYQDGLATATLAVGGTLGILIPPSVILVVYAISTEQNIAKLFMAAFVPGLLAALTYIVVIFLRVRANPSLAPLAAPEAPGARRATLPGVVPILAIALVMLGGIYGGVFTPTEGAAVGTIATLLVGLLGGGLSRSGLATALLQTAETTGMIFLILLGAEVFNAFLALSEFPTLIAEQVASLGLPPYAVLVAILAAYIVLGGVMDELAMLLLTLPVFFPVIMAQEFGLPSDETAIWFGILVLVITGIGLVAPPIGLNVFVIAGLARDVKLTAIYRGVLPFLASDLLRLGVLIAFPGLSLALVRWFT